MFYLWLCVVLVVVFREAAPCRSRNVQEIASVLEEVEDWKALAGWLDIERATINNININCPTIELAQCTWRELVKTYCDKIGGDPDRTAADIVFALDRKMHKRKQAQDLRQLKFTRGSPDQGSLRLNSPSQGPLRLNCNSPSQGPFPLREAPFPAKLLLLLSGLLAVITLLGTLCMYICHEPTTEIVPWRQILAAVLVIVAGICIAPMFPGQQNVAASSDSLDKDVDPNIYHYADYLRAMYSTTPISTSVPPIPSKTFIKLALVKKGKVSREQSHNVTRLTLQGDIDQILQVKEQIEMDDILKADDKARLVVVEGAPGIGKSTLAWELCRQWPTLESLKRFSLVVLLRLREKRVQSAKNISDLFYHRDTQLSMHVGEEVEKGEGDGVLFVFDGFDEFPSELRGKSDSNQSFVMDIISGSKYLPKATVLVTSSPSASAQLQGLLQKGIDKYIEVVGFSEKEIFEFAHSVLGDSNLFTDFKAYLSANPPVRGMMYNPLNCAIVVGVYLDTYELGKPVPHTQTQLYTELILCLLSRYLDAMRDPLASELPNNLEDLPHDSDLYQQLVKVGKLAFNGKLREQVIFKQLPEGCSDLGLLVKQTALYTRKESTTYNFFHLTLQEYMSAFYISQLPADEQRTLFSECSTSMDVVWRFVAGLTKMQNIEWEEFKRVELGYWRVQPVSDVVTVDPLLLQCLYEAQYVQSCESVFGDYKLNSDVGSPYDLFVLGYFVSLCNNTWNVHIWTSKGLEMLGHGMKSVDYGGGSIEELDLVRSSPDKVKHLLHIPHQILGHIKSLGWKDSLMNQTGFDNLAECISSLHSLTSLDISHNSGGDGSLVKLLRALRENGTLLQTLYMQCISIGTDDVAALAHLIQQSSSLRELSVDGSNCGGKLQGSDIEEQLMKTVLPSSLQTLILHVSKAALLHLDLITVINVTSLSLNIYPESYPPISVSTQTANIGIKGGTKLSHILRGNTSLKELTLHIPLDKDEVHDIIDSLKDNHSLRKLVLSHVYHSQYFSLKNQQELDHRIKFT